MNEAANHSGDIDDASALERSDIEAALTLRVPRTISSCPKPDDSDVTDQAIRSIFGIEIYLQSTADLVDDPLLSTRIERTVKELDGVIEGLCKCKSCFPHRL